MVKKKSKSKSKLGAYASIVSSYYEKEKKAKADEKLEKKGVLVKREDGKYGYNPEKLKKEVRKEKIKKGFDKAGSFAYKTLNSTKKVGGKKVLKKSDMTFKVSEYKAPSVLGDENRFFKGTMENEKRSMFFS